MAFDGTLTRAQFKKACELFLRKQESSQSGNEFTARNIQGWHWLEHSAIRGLGYMFRVGSALRTISESLSGPVPEDGLVEEVEEEDHSTLSPETPSRELLTVQQYIVYSPTYQVPAFYFAMQNSNGSPLSLDQIVQTSLFRAHALPETATTVAHGISMPASNFPLLSQGDHPVLGTPCWYFHPCETSAAVTELMNESDSGEERTQTEQLLRWMEAWFLVLCSVVDLRQLP